MSVWLTTALSEYDTTTGLAAGMVCAQAQCRTLTDAIALLQELAGQLDMPLDALAEQVIERKIRFDR